MCIWLKRLSLAVSLTSILMLSEAGSIQEQDVLDSGVARENWKKNVIVPLDADAFPEATAALNEMETKAALRRVVESYMMLVERNTTEEEDDADMIRSISHLLKDQYSQELLIEVVSELKDGTMENRQRTVDKFVHGLLRTIADPDCMLREFDVADEEFDASEASNVLQKCKLVVLRNVFDKEFLSEYREDFTKLIQGIHAGRISSSGTTSNGEGYFVQQLDHKRWEIILPRELAREEIIADEDVLNIVTEDQILGENLVLHSLGSAIAESGADAQRWHLDDDYLFSGASFDTSGIAGHDLPSYAITMMIPLLNMTKSHGPTEFCMGSSFLSGLNPDDVTLQDERLRSVVDTYFDLTNNDDVSIPCPYTRTPELNFGDMLLFDYQIVHRGGANSSPDLRSVMYSTYSRKWYKDANFSDKDGDEDEEDDYEQDDYEEDEEMKELFKQLTRSARFGVPDGEFDIDNEPQEAGEGLEGIAEFLPPHIFYD